MKILFIAPLPPPVTGQSLAVSIFKTSIEKENHVEVANLVKESFKSGTGSIHRIITVLKVFKDVWRKKKNSDRIYFTISESIAGNLKDLLIYLLCFNKLSKMYIHLHGGAGMSVIMKKNPYLSWLNIYFLKKLRGIIVLGKTHADIYNFIDPIKIHVVPNFAENDIFIPEESLRKKFENIGIINLLFLSNLIPGKGYLELVSSFNQLEDSVKQRLRIRFAGGFESERHKDEFLENIKGISQLSYEGIVEGSLKKQLFHDAHVFCLPTYYPYEGQPISILEAYAAGCAVITTNHSGIRDVFTDKVNGIEVKKKSVNSLKSALELVSAEPQNLFQIAYKNRKIAFENFRTENYNNSLRRILYN